MGKIVKTILYLLPFLAVFAACDKTVDGYWPSGEYINLFEIDNDSIIMGAVPSERTIEIRANCAWTAAVTGGNDKVFSIYPTSGEGSGVITISTNSTNTGISVTKTEITVTAGAIGKTFKINVSQDYMRIQMEQQDDSVTPEEGGSVKISFESTVDWELVPTSTAEAYKMDWLEFSPGNKGEGLNYTINVEAKWRPNYTTQPRELTLALEPQDKTTIYTQYPFTLRQEAGTLPQNVSIKMNGINMYGATCSVSYVSKSPVTKCQVTLKNVVSGETKTNTAVTSGDTYPLEGNFELPFENLDYNTTYEASVYVENMVGPCTDVPPITFTTLDDASRKEFEGVRIDSFTVEPSSKSAVARLKLYNDVEIERCMLIVTEAGVSVGRVSGENHGDGLWTFAIEGLTPRTKYVAKVEVKCEDKDSSQGTVLNPATSAEMTFITTGLIPDIDDNTTPEGDM